MGEKSETTPFRTVTPGGNQKRSTWKQVILALVAYSASLAPSMSIGFSAVAIPALISDEVAPLTMSQASWFASIASIATPLGCLISGPTSDRLGRKSVLLMVNLITFIGWITIAVAMDLKDARYATLIVGRLLTGFSTGFASMPPVVYMSEVSTPRLRGVFTTANGVFFAIGILTVYVFGAIFPASCGTVAVLTAILPCISMVLVTFILPETPQWLVTNNRIDEASTNMQRIYGYTEYTPEIYNDIQDLIQRREANKVTLKTSTENLSKKLQKFIEPFRRPTCYKPFLIVQTFFFFQQFTGTFVIVFYAIDIVEEAGVQINSYIAIVLIAFVRFLGAVLVSFISRNYGRRPISLISGVGMTFTMCLLAVYLHQQWQGVSWLPFACLMVYFFTSTLGFITMPFALAAECFPAEIKGTVTGVITCFAYLFNFIVVKIYPSLIVGIGAFGTFMFYGLFSAAGTLFVYFLLPETKGKTLAEIEEYFGGKSKCSQIQNGDESVHEKMLQAS